MLNKNEYKIYQPKYYNEFKCDPVKCKETCCERWNIIVDKTTYNKYISSINPTISRIVSAGLSKNKKSTKDDDYGVINLDSEGKCPFLGKGGLCEVFINMGESCLSKTCKSYPRTIIAVNDGIERGLEMSCSIATELIIGNKQGIQFELITETVDFKDFYVILPELEPDYISVINEIKLAAIDILKMREFGVDNRLELLGHFLNKIRREVDFSDTNNMDVLTKIKEIKLSFKPDKFKVPRVNKKIHEGFQFHHLNNILSMKFKEGDSISFFSSRYIECLMQVLDAFGRIKEKDLERSFKKNNEKYLKPYLDRKSYMLENLLVNYVFIYSIELFKSNNIWNSYLRLCVIYGLVKLNLVGLAIFNKGIDDDLVFKLLQSLSKTVMTDKTYMDAIIKYLEHENLVELDSIMGIILD